MKIIIEVDGPQSQAEIRREPAEVREQQVVVNTAVGTPSSGIDAGEPRMGDANRGDSGIVESLQSFQGNNNFISSGAIDAGASRVQEVSAPAIAMPDTGNMETFNTANAFSAGAVANPVSN